MSRLINRKNLVANPYVFFISLIFIISLIAIGVFFPNSMDKSLEEARLWTSNNFGWFFVITVNIILIFALYLALSKYGKIRLGGEQAEPEFSNTAWFAMLFSAGMGIGIMFYSIGEPVTHFGNPPREVNNHLEAAKQAMEFTSLHWGFHTWGIYAIVGLALAFFGFNRRLPMTFRSLFYPFLGRKINGPWGDLIDILSVLATVFGLATSLGLGVLQISTGLDYLYGWHLSPALQAIVILGVISVATVSVFLGIEKGVKNLSTANMYMALGLVIFIFLLGPTLAILRGFVENTGSYLANLTDISTWNEIYTDSHWQNTWTVFYWGWWIAWSPFVGSFIARISKGRTIREFVLGVLVVPALISILWMNVFGGSALDMIIGGETEMLTAVQEDITSSLFVFLENFPLSQFSSLLAVLLVFSFFVTSSDSGSLVVDNITSGSFENSPVWQRVFWSFMQGGIAIALLLSGGLDALQTGVIITGLPFAAVLLILCYSLNKGVKEEYNRWQKNLKSREEKGYKETISELLDEQQKSES